jgi:hypothetical protein
MTQPGRLTFRQEQALAALRAAGGRATVGQMVERNLLACNPDALDRFGRNADRISWGVTLAHLERKGLVESVYQSMESAGASKVWTIAAPQSDNGPR